MRALVRARRVTRGSNLARVIRTPTPSRAAAESRRPASTLSPSASPRWSRPRSSLASPFFSCASATVASPVSSASLGGRPLAAASCFSTTAAAPTPTSTSATPARSFPFELSPAFLRGFEGRPVPFGFNGLGELVYLRTYSRLKDDGSGGREQWWETVARVVNGTFSMQKRWVEGSALAWDEATARAEAEDMYERIFDMKVTERTKRMRRDAQCWNVLDVC